MDPRFSTLLQQLQDEHESQRSELRSVTSLLSDIQTKLEATRSELLSSEKTLHSTQQQLSNALAGIQILERKLSGSRPVKQPTQFLDLPAEIRNQIYEYVAASVFEVPILIANSPTSELVPMWSGRKFIREASEEHNLRRGPAHRHRLALLYTCRQIYQEASLLIYSSMVLDLRFITRDVMRSEVRLLTTIFRHILQHIRHIEIEHRLLDNLLEPLTRQLDYAREHWNGKKWTVKYRKDSADARDRYARLWRKNTWYDNTSSATIKQILRLRTCLFSIESITPYSDPEDEEDVGQLGVDFMYKLACWDSMPPKAIPRLFPNLVDVRMISEYGSERLEIQEDGRGRLGIVVLT